MSDLVMPRLSDTMEEGTVLRWLKRDGEHVRRGEELVEIETDKAAMTYESDLEGTLHTIAREGDTLAVGESIARIGDSGEEPPREAEPAERTKSAGTTPAEAGGRSEPSERPLAASERPTVDEDEPASETHTPPRLKASPLARRIARERGVELTTLTGSGPGGRIVKADVEASAAAEAEPASAAGNVGAAAPQTSESPAERVASAKGATTSIEPSRTQRAIARRMAESKATIPDFTLTADIDMERCVELRSELKRLSDDAGGQMGGRVGGRMGGRVPTHNDMIVKACALALREHPRANASWRDGRFELHARVNVGVAVAVAPEDPHASALVVPTIFDADTKALGEIARETRALAARVRDATITPPELSGATFTVSNLGMYRIRQFTAIVNPPQAAILAVGEVAPRPVARKKKVAVRTAMTVTLSCDHRILYGADAALFLARVRELLEEPTALAL